MDYMSKYIRKARITSIITRALTILIVAIIAAVIVLAVIFYEDPMAQYNNGIHADDGGKWAYDGFVITKNRSRYSYHCDTCGRSIVLDEWRK